MSEPRTGSRALTRSDAPAIFTLSGGVIAGITPKPALLESISRALPAFSRKSHERLAEILSGAGFRGQLPASDVKRIAARERKGTGRLTIDLLPLAESFSRPSLSGYRVGAIIQGTSGHLYLGGNLEVPANVLGFSVHAEQSASFNAYMSGESGIAALAVTAAPCGHCRQFLNELSAGRDIRILLKTGLRSRLSALLPYPFGPKDLGMTESPFSRKRQSITLAADSADELAAQALEMARQSYAPYSKSPSGVAVRSVSGRVYSGSYIENAAFNPSLSPLQTALVGMSMANEDFANIAAVDLVELDQAPISQESATRAVMSALAPGSQLRILRGKPG